jgi:hypothetical protein
MITSGITTSPYVLTAALVCLRVSMSITYVALGTASCRNI